MSGLQKLYFGWSAYFKAPWGTAVLPVEVRTLYAEDGLNIMSGSVTCGKVMLIVEVCADKSPQWIAGRLKGRLQYFLNQRFTDFPGFDRAFHLESLGQNDRSIVSGYVQSQVNRSELVDPLYRERMNELRFHDQSESRESTSHRGRYDLVVHMVLVIANRQRIFSREARQVFEALVAGCEELGCKTYDISMMPDHAHLMVGWPPAMSADELLEGVKGASGKVMRRMAFWQDGGYAGTVGPYKMSVAIAKNRRAGGW